MFALLVGLELLILLGAGLASAWGWKHLESQRRIRLRSGPTGIDWTISKNIALVLTPLICLLVVTATVVLRDSPNRVNVAGAGAAMMTISLVAHWSSMKRSA